MKLIIDQRLLDDLSDIQIKQLKKIIKLGKVDYSKIKHHDELESLCNIISDHIYSPDCHSSHLENKDGLEFQPMDCWECKNSYVSTNSAFCSQKCQENCLDHVPFFDKDKNQVIVKCYEPRHEDEPDYEWVFVKGMSTCPFCESELKLDFDQAEQTEFGVEKFGFLPDGKPDSRTFSEKLGSDSGLFTKSQKSLLGI